MVLRGKFIAIKSYLKKQEKHRIDNIALHLKQLEEEEEQQQQQKINKETQAWNDKLDQMDLIDIFRTVHPNAEEYTFFSSAHGTFSRIDYILGHKSNLSKFKKIEIILSIFSDHNAIRLDIKNCKQHKHAD